MQDTASMAATAAAKGQPTVVPATKPAGTDQPSLARNFSNTLAAEFIAKADAVVSLKPANELGKSAGEERLEEAAILLHNQRIMGLNQLQQNCCDRLNEWLRTQTASAYLRAEAKQMFARIELLYSRYTARIKQALQTDRDRIAAMFASKQEEYRPNPLAPWRKDEVPPRATRPIAAPARLDSAATARPVRPAVVPAVRPVREASADLRCQFTHPETGKRCGGYHLKDGPFCYGHSRGKTIRQTATDSGTAGTMPAANGEPGTDLHAKKPRRVRRWFRKPAGWVDPPKSSKSSDRVEAPAALSEQSDAARPTRPNIDDQIAAIKTRYGQLIEAETTSYQERVARLKKERDQEIIRLLKA